MEDQGIPPQIKARQDTLRRALNKYGRWGLKLTAIGIAVIGIAVLAIWAITRDSSAMSMLMFLTGISAVAIAVILYYLSPSQYLRSDVSNAMARSGTENTGNIIASLFIGSRGIYIPSGPDGTIRIFIPVTGGIDPGKIGSLSAASGTIFNVDGGRVNGIVIKPPGDGLLEYSRSIGALFTPDGLDYEIRDLLQNGLELVSRVRVHRDGNIVRVSMRGAANAGLCSRIREENPAVCTQTGCPLCSFVTCMVAEGTGRMARIENVSVHGSSIDLSVELMGE